MEISGYQKAPNIVGEDQKDTALLMILLEKAKLYISRFPWSGDIANIYLADGVGGIFAIFLVEYKSKIDSGDRFIWLVVGDFPSAYLVTDNLGNVADVLSAYCALMEDWIDAVISGESLDNVFPVEAAPTATNARALENRIEFLRTKIMQD
jgi:hypothetical protein